MTHKIIEDSEDPENVKLMELLKEGHYINLDIEKLPAIVWGLCQEDFTLNMHSVNIDYGIVRDKEIITVRCKLEHAPIKRRTY